MSKKAKPAAAEAAETTAETRWPADHVERRAVDSLVPYAKNARTHSPEQISQIAASIREFGFTVPVLVDEDGTIIAGHGRVLAAQKLELQDVPVIVARGWTDAQRRAYVLADNQIALNAGWDEELLKIELGDLHAHDFDLGLIGFEPSELSDLLYPELKTKGDEELEAAHRALQEEEEAARADGEDIETAYCCPSCGYRWSGKADAGDAE